jgi:hypothetical protein
MNYGRRKVPMNSDTPRTDAVIDSMMFNRASVVGSHVVFTQMVLAGFARELERENQQLRDGLKVCKEALSKCDWHLSALRQTSKEVFESSSRMISARVHDEVVKPALARANQLLQTLKEK